MAQAVPRSVESFEQERASRRGMAYAMPEIANDNEPQEKKKLQGIGFWAIVGLAIIKDILDIFLNITILLSVVVIPVTFMISFGVFMYLYLNGVKIDTRKGATIFVGFFMDALPFLSFLPTFTCTLFVIKWMENGGGGRLGKLAGGTTQKK